MKIGVKNTGFDALFHETLLIPISPEGVVADWLPEEITTPIRTALTGGKLKPAPGSLCAMTICVGARIRNVTLMRTGDPGVDSNREIFLRYASALRRCGEFDAESAAILICLDHDVSGRQDLCRKLCELPFLVGYDFNAYKTGERAASVRSVDFVTNMPGFDDIVSEATICGESAILARDLVNHPSSYMTPSRFAEEAEKVCSECGIGISVLDRRAIEAHNMRAFLAVAKATGDEPRLIVMRYLGGRGGQGEKSGERHLALVGKGIMFDSGGYAIKSAMSTMHDDMGGAAAVLGAMRAIAKRGLRINVTGVIPACRNMISPDAFVPGDIIESMAGRTIQVLNTDAEGRLILADGITYAIREEGADEIVDIATLTGAAKGAVGNRSAAVFSNSDELYDEARRASVASCEKIWRLDLDMELRRLLDSPVADIANSRPGNTAGGGAIIAALFLREFIEDKPWLHIDMAPVNWATEDGAYFKKGATGYGTSLLYKLAEIKSQRR
ncbi:MAG: leucyl aminopeptidase family protein [Synergistaceae bacterium]|jgi:leucyl aminopeptidase|nr:leucyl aminopeptidase family protein [Synergistaceae bacterium]